MRWLAVAVLAYLAIAGWDIETPGLGYDEAYDAAIAVEWRHGQPLDAAGVVRVGGLTVPVMSTEIEGPLPIYLSAAVFRVFGTTVTAVRWLHIAIGAMTLGLLWTLTRRWADETAAAFAVLLCATCPPFVWWSRAGGHWNALLLPISLGMFLAWGHAWRTRRSSWMGVTGVLAGAGVTTKILFVWWLIPMVGTAWWAARKRGGTGTWSWVSWRHRVAGATGLAVGAAPLIVHNWPDLRTLRFVLRNLGTTELYGYRNLDLATHIASQWAAWVRVIGGDTVAFSGRPGLPVGAGLVAWAVVATTRAVWRRARDGSPGAGDMVRVFLITSLCTIVSLSAVSTSHSGPAYLLLIIPAVWTLVGMALSDVATGSGGRGPARRVRAFVAIVAVTVVAYQGVMNVRVLRALHRTGGSGAWSDAVSQLAVVLEQEFAGRSVVAMDWGLARNLVVLTDGRLRPTEVYERRPTPSAGAEAACASLLADPTHVYVRHAPPHSAFPGVWERCLRVAGEQHLALRRARLLRTRTGEPVIEIYTAEPE